MYPGMRREAFTAMLKRRRLREEYVEEALASRIDWGAGAQLEPEALRAITEATRQGGDEVAQICRATMEFQDWMGPLDRPPSREVSAASGSH